MRRRSTFTVLCLPLLVAVPGLGPASQAPSCVIGPRGIGPVHLGITLDSARRAFPGARFERDTDADGAALVAVMLGASALMSVYAGEDDAETPVAWSRTIEVVETFSPRCRFANGVGPGTLVTDVAKLYGPVTRVTESEIESRQFVEFERQPAGAIFRLDYTGVFDEGSRVSTRVAPGGKIFSVAIARPH